MGAILKIISRGIWAETFLHLKYLQATSPESIIERYAQQGVAALSAATPKDTGLAASQWRYEIEKTKEGYTLSFHNDDIENGYNVAILIQYGHGLKNGGYVAGQDYINPAIKPIFDGIVNDIWKEVQNR